VVKIRSEVFPRVAVPVHILCASSNFIYGTDLHQYLMSTGNQDMLSAHPQEMRISWCVTCRYRAISYSYILQCITCSEAMCLLQRSPFFSCPSTVTRLLTLPLIHMQNPSRFLPTPSHSSDFCQ